MPVFAFRTWWTRIVMLRLAAILKLWTLGWPTLLAATLCLGGLLRCGRVRCVA